MKKRKFLVSVLSLLIMVTSLGIGTIANASESQNASEIISVKGFEDFQIIKTYYNNERIVPNEYSLINFLNGNGVLTNERTGEILNVEVKSTSTEKINDLINKRTGETASTFRTDVVLEDSTTNNQQSGSESDKGLGMKVYATIYYITTTNKDGFNFVGIDKVSHRFEINDSSYKVSFKQMQIAQNGVGYPDMKAITKQDKTINIEDSGTELVRNYGWTPILKYGLGYTVGINITAKIQRGQQSNWDFKFNFPVT
ncbi:hypothetical protein ABU162_24985 [Paenibacillus thiaminolyticus]|uniref:hypothetical protein n=1 Tax=Paenibacillus thiaminolyticus TaxID=49283 RepID=UPI0035A652F8